VCQWLEKETKEIELHGAWPSKTKSHIPFQLPTAHKVLIKKQAKTD
jgi:hypothetical protein